MFASSLYDLTAYSTLMLHFHIADPSEVVHARRLVSELAQTLGMSATEVGNVALVATEMGTNILKHAVRGELVAHGVKQQQTTTMELLALDRGPGMANVAECLRDGYSTAGSAGTGLGAILRASTATDMYSLPNVGTAIFSRIVANFAQQRHRRSVAFAESLASTGVEEFTTGVVSIAKTGQQVCGDGWASSQSPQRYRVMVVDGIGHGAGAGEAAQHAVRIFQQRIAASLPDLMGAMHQALRSTRGAVVAVAEINRTEQLVHYCGVGNISAALLTAQETKSLVSLNGTVGYQLPTLKVFSYPWNANMVLIMHSDGLATRWSIDQYPGLLARHPMLIAGVLYRDCHRGGRDDVTVAVAKLMDKKTEQRKQISNLF